jgi:hypothetical protein
MKPGFEGKAGLFLFRIFACIRFRLLPLIPIRDVSSRKLVSGHLACRSF